METAIRMRDSRCIRVRERERLERQIAHDLIVRADEKRNAAGLAGAGDHRHVAEIARAVADDVYSRDAEASRGGKLSEIVCVGIADAGAFEFAPFGRRAEEVAVI